MKEYYGHGKLLLTGEYTVLDGALSLAVPTRFGQYLRVQLGVNQGITWTSLDHSGTPWLALRWSLLESDQPEVIVGETGAALRLVEILQAAEQLKSGTLAQLKGLAITTELEFDREWGLGSSSTLFHCLGEWLSVDPFALLAATFGGSGYDLACAAAGGPIEYQLVGGAPQWSEIDWSPDWLVRTYFVYRNQKQNSRAGIRKYREKPADLGTIEAITALTEALKECEFFGDARRIITEHERITSSIIDQPAVKDALFPDFPGAIKSLGAWGGDFMWVATELDDRRVRAYFFDKGFPTVLGWSDMI
ncbi:MAG: GYDIA family GHMP kinase [Bacteroidota bacterium]